jgi:aminopeptidase N
MRSLPPVCLLALAVLPAILAAADPEPPGLRLPTGPRPTLYELELAVDPTQSTFAGEVRVHLELAAATTLLWLNATELSVDRANVSVAGRVLAARTVAGGEDFVGFAFEAPVGPGAALLTVSYRGPIDDVRSRGLYRVREPDGEWHAYTFFEPIDARRVVPCFDEPAFKVPWRLRLKVRRGDVALANAPVEAEHASEDGRKLVSFVETKPLPSYLLAFVVGPFDVVESGTAGRHGTPLRFVLPRGRREELRYAREVTPRVVELLEDFFEMPYPFLKLDVAVVPRFWGTMEHPGLVAMGQPLTLIKPAEETVDRRRSYANILIHELAHYWFGDYVTHAWWDDIWLNEALATWLDTKLTARLEPSWRYPEWSMLLDGYARDKDALSTARSIRQPVLSRSDIESSFDNATTYSKGSAALRMFEHWVGEEPMRKALRAYLGSKAWGNATYADLATALDATGRDVAGALATFLDQPGLPVVTVSSNCGPTGARLKLRQERFLRLAVPGPAPTQTWRIPVCLRWPDRATTRRTCVLLLAPEQTIDIDSCPTWLLANDAAAGYYRVAYDGDARHRLAAEAASGSRSALAPVERIAFLDDLEALAGGGRLPIGLALEALPWALKDPDPLVVSEALDLLQLLKPDRLSTDLGPRYARLVQGLLGSRAKALGWEPAEEAPDVRHLRGRLVPHAALYGEDSTLATEARRLTLAWLSDRQAADADLVWGLLRAAASNGDRSLFDRLLAEVRRSKDREDQSKLFWALGSFRDPALVTRALELLLDTDFDARESVAILWGLMGRRATQDAAWAFVRDQFETLAARSRSDETSWLVGGIVSRFCDEDFRREAAAFFTPRVARIDGAALPLANALETVDACVAEERRNAAAVAEFLRRY